MLTVEAAIGAAIAINAGYVVQHLGLATAPPIELRRPLAAVASLLRSRRWVAGAALGYGGLGLEFVALTELPLSAVQAAIGAGLVLVAALSRAPRGGAAPRGAALTILSLAILVWVTPATAAPHAVHAAWAVAVATVLVTGGAALLARRVPSAVGLGVAAGLLYGLTSVAMASLAPILTGRWPAPVVVLTAVGLGVPLTIAAFLAFQRALQRGRPLAVVTAMMSAMDAVAMAGGILLLGDPLAAGTAARVAQLGALALSVLSAVVVLGDRGADKLTAASSAGARGRSAPRTRRARA
jgi:hypothetical protein